MPNCRKGLSSLGIKLIGFIEELADKFKGLFIQLTPSHKILMRAIIFFIR
jgi:hypothetical protein